MSFLADLLSTVFERRYRSALEPDLTGRSIEELCHDLLGSSGEVSGSVTARHILDRYAAMDEDGKQAFFSFLAQDLGLDPDAVRDALDAFEQDPSKSHYRAFTTASEPKRQELARRLNQIPGATAQLVQMRDDLLRYAKSRPELAPVDQDFQHLFASWFNRGFLVLRPINWESPAEVLEKIIAYEAVHAIGSWDDLRRRVQPSDRRCFAFFHPAMPNEPLIFVEVALTRGVPGSVQALLSDAREEISGVAADTAVFYSISNCQSGLAGISFGNSLIKQVAADLSRDLSGIETFVTLSPIPGLNDWLAETGLSVGEDTPAQRRAAAYYLLGAKRSDGSPRDPVARFHLGNGAHVHDVHARADLSPNGMAQSSGLMVNYLYDLTSIAQNHEGYAAERKVAASAQVQALAAEFEKTTQ
ncbi:malonyl-CoA decarboxylase [Roseobacter sp. YSTF-M11]|uniref:Malonyl-CoA decarboxylase n=1 Tax=Roseobacter insulae TaxID=2859783 RepID=A0A9X1K4U4_9RHOB|nr:malonyl-CoA decarboxylase [Roseobacter insulae]MBW4710067.1 malonyl-CoA decarboxylase [Roseobacter insulae]